MKFSPLSIKNQEFNKSVRGYDRDEVKAYLEKLSDDFELLHSQNKKIQKELEELQNQTREYKKIERNLQSTLLTAQSSSTKAVESAKKQTALMLREAELKSQQILEKAKKEAEFIRDSVLKLREQKNLFIARLQAMVNTQSELLEMNVKNVETKPVVEKKIKEIDELLEFDVEKILEKLI